MSREYRGEAGALWRHLKPRLRGKWWRMEVITPAGIPDLVGLFRGQTYWMEMKIGKPDLKALRAEQRDFGIDCIESGVPFWLCFGHKHSPVFFCGVQTDVPSTPPFWRGD